MSDEECTYCVTAECPRCGWSGRRRASLTKNCPRCTEWSLKLIEYAVIHRKRCPYS